MKMKILSNGKSFEVDKTNIVLLAENDFFTSSFNFQTSLNNSGVGSYLNRILLSERTYKFSLFVKQVETMKEMQDCFSNDRSNQTPTKIYINEGYMECYVSSWENVNPGIYKDIILELEIFATNPFWIKENYYEFLKFNDTEIIHESGGMSFPFSFPFSFKQSRTNQTIVNKNPNDAHMKMIFHGPFNNVDIMIGSNRYNVITELLENERLEINQRKKTIIKTTVSGDCINMINYRNKEFSVFLPIKKGEHTVSFNGEYSFEITLFDERSEPFWN